MPVRVLGAPSALLITLLPAVTFVVQTAPTATRTSP